MAGWEPSWVFNGPRLPGCKKILGCMKKFARQYVYLSQKTPLHYWTFERKMSEHVIVSYFSWNMQKAKGQRLLRSVNKITVTRSQETRSDDIKPAHQEGRSKKTEISKVAKICTVDCHAFHSEASAKWLLRYLSERLPLEASKLLSPPWKFFSLQNCKSIFS